MPRNALTCRDRYALPVCHEARECFLLPCALTCATTSKLGIRTDVRDYEQAWQETSDAPSNL